MSAIQGRALHFVFKIIERERTVHFFRNILGMQVLRHEEFSEGCEAACNGTYDNRWSKTMVGYGPEDTHFVVELTYNYTVDAYKLGNDFLGLTIKSSEALQRAAKENWPIETGNLLTSPGGYRFYIIDEPQPTASDPVQKVTLTCSNLKNSIEYWHDLLDLKIVDQTSKSVVLGFNDHETKLELVDIGSKIEHETAYGRIAFSCPEKQLPIIQEKINAAKHKVLIPLVKLDTPGKASVTVVILADPDGHEICFVDDEGFRQLSQVDAESDALLDKSIRIEKKKLAS